MIGLLFLASIYTSSLFVAMFLWLQVTAWPGQRIPLDIHAIDQFGRATTANIRFTFEEYSVSGVMYVIVVW